MQPKNLQTSQWSKDTYAEFELASGDAFSLNIGWCNNDGKKWTFDTTIAKLPSDSWGYGSFDYSLDILKRRLAEKGFAITQQELADLNEFVITHKEKSAPHWSAYDDFHGC